MKILLTGGFGSVGSTILDLFVAEGHEVTVLELENRLNRRKARRHSSPLVTVLFGDVRNPSDVEKAVTGQEVIVHCAAILPPFSEDKKLCFDTNLGGTQNVVNAIKKHNNPAPLIYTSSSSVMGPTQDREPPVTVTDPLNPIDNYAQSKVDAENLIRNSGIRYCIFRLAAVMTRDLLDSTGQFKLMFEIPLHARCEVVLDFDVATACVHAAEIMSKSGMIDGSLFFIGGGKQNGCQITARQMFEGTFTPLGIKVPSAYLFTSNLNNYYIDWYDTAQAQQILNFQDHTFDEHCALLRKNYRFLRPLMKAFGPLTNVYFKSQSPYGKRNS